MNTIKNDALSIALNLSPHPPSEMTKVIEGELVEFNSEIKAKVKDIQYEKDLNLVRSNLIGLINDAGPMARDLIGLVLKSESPRMMDSISSIIKTVADINKDLMEVAERRHILHELEHAEAPVTQTANTGAITNQAFFVGSTEELFKLINGKNE
jgi:hypothetical protein